MCRPSSVGSAGEQVAGLYAGNPQCKTDRPTAKRLLEVFEDITLILVEGPQQTKR